MKRAGLRKRRWPVWLCCFTVLYLTGRTAQFDLSVLLTRGGRFFDILRELFPPDIPFAAKVFAPLVGTVRMSVVGTVFGCAAALAAAPFGAGNIGGFGKVRFLIRWAIQILRAIPALVLALACTFFFGIGTFAGTAALFLYTFAVMAKLGYEDVENTPMGPYMALKAAGSGSAKSFIRSVLPQMLPSYLANALYLLESNVRNAAILGYVGAGGVGLLLNEKIAWREYAKVGTILLMLFAAVVFIEGFSEWIRYRLKEDENSNRGWDKICTLATVLLVAVCLATVEPPRSDHGGLTVAFSMIGGLLSPDWELVLDFSRNGLCFLLFETVCIAVMGTAIGAILATPLSFLGSVRLMPPFVAIPVRMFLMAVRTIPVFLYGLMFIRVTGPGPFAGLLTMSVCSVGLLGKRFMTAVDNLDLGVWRAFRNLGIPLFARIKYGIWPQLVPHFSSTLLYRLDVNLREASVLGLVGAGGVGAPLIMAMNQYKWRQAGAILLGLVLLILAVELASGAIRRNFWEDAP